MNKELENKFINLCMNHTFDGIIAKEIDGYYVESVANIEKCFLKGGDKAIRKMKKEGDIQAITCDGIPIIITVKEKSK